MADADRALFVARIEAAVTDAYRLLLDKKKLDADSSDLVLVLAQHHDEHATALAAAALKARAKIGRSDRLYAELDQSLLGSDPMAAVLGVEQRLAATHLASLGVLTESLNAATVASILPIESRHVVVLDPKQLPTVEPVEGAYDEVTYG